MRWSILMIALTLLTASPALAEINEGRSLNFSEGNSDFRGKLSARAGFKSCSGAELAAKVNWQDDYIEALTQAIVRGRFNAQWMLNYLTAHPSPNNCPALNLPGYSKVYAEGDVTAKVFGKERTLADIDLSGESRGPNSRIYGRVRMKGETVWSREEGPLIFMRGVSFEEKEKFGLGPLSITVKGKASAMVGVSVNGGAAEDYIGLSGAPFANASASASASVGAACASAGIKGSLDLIDLSLPINLGLDLDEETWFVDTDLDYDLPSGNIKLKASWCAGSDSITLASFNFGGRRVNLFDAEGQF